MSDDFDEQGHRNWLGGGNGPQTDEERRTQRKRIVALAVGIVMAVFAILNFGSVKVNWIVTSGHTPLIVVIAVSFGLGIAGDRLMIARGRRRRRDES